MEELRISKATNAKKIAGAIVQSVKDGNGRTTARAVGPFAVNQLVKGITIARGFLSPHGKDLICTPAFVDVEIEGVQQTSIKVIIKEIEL